MLRAGSQIDGDGDMDMVIATSGYDNQNELYERVIATQNELYVNHGDGVFSAKDDTPITVKCSNTAAIAWGDVRSLRPLTHAH